MARNLNERRHAAVSDAMNLHLGELPRLMLRWALRRERWRVWPRVMSWAVLWGSCTIGAISRNDGAQFFYAGVAISTGSTFGRLVLGVMPVRVRVADLLKQGSCVDQFWVNLPAECGARLFAKQLRVHGGRSLIPIHREALTWGLSQVHDLGSYPSALLRDADFSDAGVRSWVDERTGGALEMAYTLCAHPSIHTLHDLVRLIERLGITWDRCAEAYGTGR